jgi:putative tryptophan/tyrosine transport system substrate-binding protein
MQVIGFLYSGTKKSLGGQYAAFKSGLKEAGYVDGENVKITYRCADDNYESKLAKHANELIKKHKVAVLVAAGGYVSAMAAKAACKTTPIVFTSGGDPVKNLVKSLEQPGRNLTGTAGRPTELDAARLELLHELRPVAKSIGVLVNPNRPAVAGQKKNLQAAAKKMGLKLVIGEAGAKSGIKKAIAALAKKKVEALLVAADPFFNSERQLVVKGAAESKIPAIYQWREFAAAGGLMSYGPRLADAYFRAGNYVGRILKGEKPADMPVTQPTTFELVINRKTAKSLGLEIPPTLLNRPGVEIIE